MTDYLHYLIWFYGDKPDFLLSKKDREIANLCGHWLNRNYILTLLSCIQFKINLHNHAARLPWYKGLSVRFRVMFFNHFKVHLVFLIGKYACKY